MISIQIQYDKSNRTFSSGEEVAGTVKVQANKECQCNKLVLTREWRTHGKGNKQSGGKKIIVLTRDVSWTPGTENSYRFNFNAPSDPVTYHGHYLNVDWYVTVKAEVPWGISRLASGSLRAPKHEEEFLLIPEDQPLSVSHKPIKKPSYFWPRAIAWLSLIFGFIYVLISIIDVYTGNPLIGFIAFVFGGLLMLWVTPRSRADRKLGEVKVSFEPIETRIGINCEVRINPKEQIHLECIRATLGVNEYVTSGSGTSQTTSTHELFKESVQKRFSQTIYPNMAFRAALPLEISKKLPVSLDINDNKINWWIELKLDLKDWLVWTRIFPLRVYRGIKAPYSIFPSNESRLGIVAEDTEDRNLPA